MRVDAEAGMRSARARADRLERASFGAFQGRHAEVLEFVRQLRALAPGDALEIEFGDDAARTLRLVIVPGEQLRFGYGSPDEEHASRSLIERCAEALECDRVLI